MKKETYRERLQNGVGSNIVRLSGEQSSEGYASGMSNCHFRCINKGNTFSLIETETPGTFTFHFDGVFVSDSCVGVYLGLLLSKDMKIISKVKALWRLYQFWHGCKLK